MASLGFVRHPKAKDPQTIRNYNRLADPSLWVSSQGVYVNGNNKLDLQLHANTANILQVGTTGLKFVATPDPSKFLKGDGTWASVTNPVGMSTTLNVNTTAAQNSGITNTTLLSYTLAAGQINVNAGDRVVVEGLFTFANNANTRSLTLAVGSQTVLSPTSFTGSAVAVARVTAIILQTGSATQIIYAELVGNSAAFGRSTSNPSFTSGTQDLTGAVALVFKGTGGATGDIVQQSMTVTYYPNHV